QITTRMLDLLGIRWGLFPTSEAEVAPALDRAVEHMNETRLPFALVMREGSVAPHTLRSRPALPPPAAPALPAADWPAGPPGRDDVLRCVQAALRPGDAVIATTGYTGRALYALGDRPAQPYLL